MSFATSTHGLPTAVGRFLPRAYSITLSPTQVPANTTAEQSFPCPGLTLNDAITINKATSQTGLGIVGVRVGAANTLAITFVNATPTAIIPAANEKYLVVATDVLSA